jgi:CRP-like cAMP-binding protein
MSSRIVKPQRTGNDLLDALPPEEYERLMPRFEPVVLSTKQLLIVEEQPVEYAWFPVNSVLSVLARTERDTFVEVATIGREGMLGIPLMLGADTIPHRAFCQIPGDCLRVRAAAFREAVGHSAAFSLVLHRYLQKLMIQLAQGGACNTRHSVEQRCARWLLMSRDRVDSDEFPITQEFLCQMLGVRRATVSEVASKFQKAGYVAYARGKMKMLDREGLSKVACECYGILRDEYSRPELPDNRVSKVQPT